MRLTFAFLLIGVSFFQIACRKSLQHERWISNQSTDTVYVWNPDFEDTIYVILPSQKAMIYSYEVLDKKQKSEECRWLGDTLYIENDNDSVCDKSVSLEYNWSSVVNGDKERIQVCTFTVYDESF